MARVWKGDLEKQFLDDMEAQDIHEDGLEAVSQRSYEYTLKYTPVILIGFSRLKWSKRFAFILRKFYIA